MNKYQFRAIRNSFKRDEIYCKGTKYNNNLIDHPIMGKEIKDVVIRGKKIDKYDHWVSYRLIKGSNTYLMWHVPYGHSSRDIAIITKNDKIIYWNDASIGNDYWPAWHILTDVHWGGYNKRTCWIWMSTEDFTAESMSLSKTIEDDPENRKRIFNEEEFKKYKKLGGYFIDKRIVTQEEVDIELKRNPNYWI